MFIVGVVGAERGGDIVFVKQSFGHPRVLSEDEIRGRQDLNRAMCDVAQVSDRRGDNVEHRYTALTSNEYVSMMRLARNFWHAWSTNVLAASISGASNAISIRFPIRTSCTPVMPT